MADRDSEPVPTTLGRYRILHRLGTGGMAEVFLAKSTGAEGIEKVLVVKRVLPTFARSAKFIQMFTQEAKVAVRLNHPAIVQVYGFEQVKDQFLLAMEFVDGLDLGRLIAAARRAARRLPFGIAAYVVMEVAKGLDYAHKRKDDEGEPLEIVHRDVSPQNVLLSYEGVVKVADFGIAKARMVSEETGVIKGKFAYMSPEQARGDHVDRRSDVYSLGVLLTELLMDRAMYPGQQGLEVLEAVRHGEVTLPRQVDPEVPPALEKICRRALAFDREERFQTARSLAGALSQWLHMQDEVYDGEALERFLGEVAPRQRTSPEGSRPANARTSTAATLASAVAGEGEHRERRHVVVLAGRVRAPDDEDGPGPGDDRSAPGIGEEAARVLADIAYKADAVLSWPDGSGGSRFRFILGLGVPSVHDPLRAVALALDVREALQGLSADLLVPLTASLGISRGVVSTVRDAGGRLLRYDPVGAVLEVAQRLAEEGHPGEVLAAGEVYRLVRRGYAFDEHGEREVAVQTDSGSSAPRGIRAYRLRGALTREERAADAMAIPEAEGLVGREDELRAVAETYREAVTAGRTIYIAVEGDLGVGKSALVAGALEGLDPRPKVLRTECTFGTSDLPFAAAAELVREACDIPDDAAPELARERLHATLDGLVTEPDRAALVRNGLELLVAPVRDEEDQPGDDADRSRLIMRAVELLLRALAKRDPLFVWVDAMQWADAPSLELIRLMMQQSYEVPVLGVFCTRPDPRIAPVVSSAPRIAIGDLGQEERRELIRRRFGGASVPADIESAIVERAGGNPFFVIELVDALLERGAVAVEGEGEERQVVRRPEVAFSLPTTLEGVIAARLGELPEGHRRLLRWLAVAGPGLRAQDLRELAGGDLEPTLEELERRGLVQRRHGGAYGFPSAVVRHVAYEQTDADDRVRMHKRIAKHLQGLGPSAAPPGRIARHLERGGLLGEAAEAYFEAAQAARRVFSNREALRFYGRALALLPGSSPRRFWAHEAREQIFRGLGHRAEQAQELEGLRAYAERAADPSMLALAYNRLARHALDGSELGDVESHLDRALEAAREAGERGAEVEALRLLAQLDQERGDPHGALAHAEEALARAGLDRSLLAARGSVLVQRATLLRRIGRLDEALEANAEAVVLFRRLGVKRNEAQALNALGVALASIGAFEDAITLIRASVKLDREIGDRFHLGRKLSNVGQLYGELGDVDRGLAFLRRANDVFDAVEDQGAQADALSAHAEALLEGPGDLDAAGLELDHARRIAERTGDRYDLARERIVRATLETVAGRLERAERCAREAAEYARTGGIVAYELQAQGILSETLAKLGRQDEAYELAQQVRDGLAEQRGVERAERIHLALAHAFAALGHPEQAQAALAEAARTVDERAADIRDTGLRDRYLARPIVREVRDANV